jgi:hypothetical protein
MSRKNDIRLNKDFSTLPKLGKGTEPLFLAVESAVIVKAEARTPLQQKNRIE